MSGRVEHQPAAARWCVDVHQLARSTTQGEPDLGQHRPEPGTAAPIALGRRSGGHAAGSSPRGHPRRDRPATAVDPTGRMPAHRAGASGARAASNRTALPEPTTRSTWTPARCGNRTLRSSTAPSSKITGGVYAIVTPLHRMCPRAREEAQAACAFRQLLEDQRRVLGDGHRIQRSPSAPWRRSSRSFSQHRIDSTVDSRACRQPRLVHPNSRRIHAHPHPASPAGSTTPSWSRTKCASASTSVTMSATSGSASASRRCCWSRRSKSASSG